MATTTYHPQEDRLNLVLGDISEQAADAIVNAANRDLLPGSGVDGAIHRRAGPGLAAECRTLGGCPPGEARITGGHSLPARHVIHTVAPGWPGLLAAWLQGLWGTSPDGVLARCYRSCLELAERHRLKTVAFSALGTGVGGYPQLRAARIAVKEIRAFLVGSRAVGRVTIVCYTQATFDAYRQAMGH